jgi:DNA-binding response OmpR family regulator
VRFRQQVILANPYPDENRVLSAVLDAEGFEVITRTTPKSAADTVVSQPFDLLIADSAFVLTGGVPRRRPSRVIRETPVIVLGDAEANRSCAALGSQIMFLERPIDRTVFNCTVMMALMEARAERRSPRRTVPPVRSDRGTA